MIDRFCDFVLLLFVVVAILQPTPAQAQLRLTHVVEAAGCYTMAHMDPKDIGYSVTDTAVVLKHLSDTTEPYSEHPKRGWLMSTVWTLMIDIGVVEEMLPGGPVQQQTTGELVATTGLLYATELIYTNNAYPVCTKVKERAYEHLSLSEAKSV